MRAAIYCRRSTEQTGGKKGESVGRQEQLAREFAETRGWTVARDHLFVDDGISGAEFERRPGLTALRAAARRGEFRVVVVSEQKSLGREMIAVGSLLKELAENGVEVWSYMDQRSLTPRNALEKAMSSLRSFGDEAHREDTSRRNHEGATSKHARGHVVGGRVFGYRNVDVCDGVDEHGRPRRLYVDREIVPDQAATVVRIFEMYASGLGQRGIAIRLTAEGIAGPKPFARKDGTGLDPYRGWAPSTVRAILGREDYRGVYVWNRSKKRDEYGKKDQRPRPESDWKRVEKPHWRIVSDELWNAVAERRKLVEEQAVRFKDGKLRGKICGRPPKGAVTNLLAGLAKCAVCGGGLVVETYVHSKKKPRVPHYVCARRRASGEKACSNALRIPVEDMNEAVLTAIEEHALRPEAVEAVVAATQRDVSAAVARSLEMELKEVERKIARLTDAIAAGGDLASLVGKLRELEARKVEIADEQAAARPVPMPPRCEVEDRLAEWRELLRKNVQTARAVLDRVLNGRIVFEPMGAGYEFECPTRYDKLFSGVVVPKSALAAHGFDAADVYCRAEDTGLDFGEVLRRAMVRADRTKMASPAGPNIGDDRTKMASPTGFEPVFWP